MTNNNTDTVTVLQAVGPKFYGKKFTNGKAYDQSGERPVWHTIKLETVAGLEDWARLHALYRGNRRVCVTRNKPLPHDANAPEMRVRNGRPQYRRQKVNFMDQARYWVMIDFDNAHINKFDWRKEPEHAALETIHRHMPEEFRKADFFWFYSASQGITKGHDGAVNLHVVFWMDRKVTNFEWRAWIQQHDLDGTLSDCVDESLFNDTQPHFINDPILDDTPDPFKNIPRSGLWKGRKAEVEFILDENAVAPEVNAEIYKSDDIFDVIEQYEKSEEAKAFNKFVSIHKVLERYGFVCKIGTPYGQPLDEKWQCRYLDPNSESGVAGVGVSIDGELHSFHDSGLFRADKFYDSFESYLLLAQHERVLEMQAVGMDFDELGDEFMEQEERAEVDPAAALENIDAQRAFENADSPLLVAKVKAHKLTVHAALSWLNEHYFLLRKDTENVFNYFEELDPKKGKQLDFHKKTKVSELLQFKFQNSYVERDDDGNQILISRPVNIIKTFMAWPKHRYYDDVGLFFGKGTRRQLDLWEGYTVDPLAGDWSVIAYHMKTVLCQDDPVKYEYLLDLLASWVQHPDEKYGVALVLIGDKGTGKNAFFDFLATLYSPAQVLCDSNPDTFFGSFNSMLMGKVLVGLDEVGFGGDHVIGRKLKTLVTQPSIVINRKGVPAIDTHNHTHLVFMSNELWAVQTSRDERRFFVLRMSNRHQQETAYFNKLFAAIKDRRVRAAFLHDMQTRKVKRNVREIVRTDTLRDIAMYSESVVVRWLMDMLEYGVCNHARGHALEYLVDEKEWGTELFYRRIWDGVNHPDWGMPVPLNLLRHDFQIYCDKNRVQYRTTMAQLSHEITEVLGVKSSRLWSTAEEEGEKDGRGLKYTMFEFPTEEALAKKLGQEAPEKKKQDEIAAEALAEFRRAGIKLVPDEKG